jgi:glycosyltransferase involved in cell wall biosynthesis
MRRVLVVEAAGNLWGSERSLLDLLSAVPRLDVAVCCPPDSPLIAVLRQRGIRVLPYYVSDLHEKSRWERMRAATGVLRACLTFRPDVIHLNQSGSYKVVLPAARMLRIPIVAHVRIFEDAAYLAQQRPDSGRVACLIAISDAVKEELRGFRELDAIPIRKMYNAYVSQTQVRDRSERDSQLIACVGRLVPIKGHDVLLKALALLRQTHPGIRCLMVGEGEASFVRDLKEIAAGAGLTDEIEWRGYADDIAGLLGTCAVLACPSYREPLGRVILEAWDAGAIPVVFAGSGGAAEVVSAADGGVIYPQQTPESLARALREALGLDSATPARMIENGRKWTAANCDPAAYGGAISDIMEAAAGFRRGRPARALSIEAAGNLWGSERSLLDLLTALPDLQVAVCCPPNTPLTVELATRGVRTLPYYVYGLHLRSRAHRARAALGVLRACLVFRPDVMHLNQSGSYKVALPAARALGIPIVAHIRIFEDVEYLARQRPDPRVLRGLIAISRTVEAEIHRYPALSGIPLHRLYDSYVPAPSVTRQPSERPRLACVGRLVPIKGQDVLLSALVLLKARGLTVECVIAGEGDDDFATALKRTASRAGLASSVQWLGFVRDIAPLLERCSVLVCPSHREPLGRVIFEAWDAGVVPVVFAGSGGAAEIVSAAGGGIVYDEQTPESLCDALVRAFALNRDDAQRMVDNGRSWMAMHCDPARYGRAVSAILTGAGGRTAEPQQA